MSNSAAPWTVVCQAPLSVGFTKQEHWSGLPPLPGGLPPGDLPNPGTEPECPAPPASAGRFFTSVRPGNHTWLGGLSAVSSAGPMPPGPGTDEDEL